MNLLVDVRNHDECGVIGIMKDR